MRKVYRIAAGIFLMAILCVGQVAYADDLGVLLLAHGASNMGMAHNMEEPEHAGHARPPIWEENVENLARELNGRRPTELAFGMADAQSMQAGIDRLEARGVRRILVVPLFISSHSPIIGNFRYILGLDEKPAATSAIRHLERVHAKAALSFAEAIDGNPIISEILLEHATEMSQDPAKTDVVVIAHGPNDEEENRAWLQDMESHAAYMRTRGGFHNIRTLTLRDDADADVKRTARSEFRRAVEAANGDAGETVVVPLLLSEGGIEDEIRTDLKGLSFKFGKPLMPHPNMVRWVEDQIRRVPAETH